jgi:uncharacterized NAD(P)/FAD-binding protein YdhS
MEPADLTHVAIIGAGLSGALQAIHLARAGIGRITLIERGRVPGRGVAYGTGRSEHLLNVPARRMTAFPDRPDHFVDWFERTAGGDAEAYAPRMAYGDYIASLLAELGDRVTIVSGEAVDVAAGPDGEHVKLADGREILADAAILALGNLRPAVPGGIDAAALGDAWIGDPWSDLRVEGLGEDDTVVLIGTGLTAVDAILTLDALGYGGRILAISRRGLAPRAHEPREPMVAPREALPSNCVALLRRIRRRSEEVGWRSAVHELRTITQGLWRGASEAERRRFLRHLRPWWDVHRHRIAPAVGAAVDRLQRAGRLRFAAGKIVAVAPAPGGARIDWRVRGTDRVETIHAARIVNCTGPELDIVRAGEALFDALLVAGRIRPDPCRIGIDTDPDSLGAIAKDGRVSRTLFVIGPPTKGAFWESIAVPDIRVQTDALAKRLAVSTDRP